MSVKVIGADRVIKRLQKLGEEYPREFIARATHDLHERAVKKASPHTKTGRMEQNIAMRANGLTGEVYVENDGMETEAGVNYAVFVHFGTRPHDIRPKNKKALRWVGHGDVFRFAKSVRHPGYRGDPFMYDAADETEKIFDQIAKDVIDELK